MDSALRKSTIDVRLTSLMKQLPIFFFIAKSLKLIEPNIQIETTFQDIFIQIHLKSDAFAKSVELSTLVNKGTFSDNFFNLFPDEPVQVQFLPKNPVENKLPYFQIRSLYDVLDK